MAPPRFPCRRGCMCAVYIAPAVILRCAETVANSHIYTHPNPIWNRKRVCASLSIEVLTYQFELSCLFGFRQFRVEGRGREGCLTPRSCRRPPLHIRMRSPGNEHRLSVTDVIPMHSDPAWSANLLVIQYWKPLLTVTARFHARVLRLSELGRVCALRVQNK